MHIATPNSTLRPLAEAGEDERDDEGDFAFLLSLDFFLLSGVTATARRAEADGALVTGADAVTFVTGAPVIFTCLPEKGL